MSAWFIPALAALLALLLLVAAWGDLRTRTIPNRLNGLIAILAPLWWWANALPLWPGVAMQVAAALTLFAIFAALFAAGMMGGGDVKMIAALALWLPLPGVLRMLVVMALLGGVLTLVVLLDHRRRGRPGAPEIPYGVAIAAAGLWEIANGILTSSDH